MATTLNQQIMDAIKSYSDLNTTVASRYGNQPGFESGARATIMGQDTGLQNLMTGYSDKVKELYNYDRTKNASMANINVPSSVTTEGGYTMPVNPDIQAGAEQAGFKQTLNEKEAAWQLYEGRKALLGDALDKAIKVYESETEMKKADRDALEKTIGFLQKERDSGLAEKELNLKYSSSGLGDYSLSDEEIKNIDTSSLNGNDLVAIAKQIYGPNVKLGTQTQAPAYAKTLIDNYKKNGYDIQVLAANMDAETSDRFLGALKFIPDAQTVIDSLKSDTLGTSLGDITSGPLAGILGPISGQTSTSPEMTTRQLLDQMRAEKIKEFYGGAFTTTEMQNAKWLPGSQRQEYKNLTALTAMQKSAYDKVKGALALLGVSGPSADKVIQDALADLNLSSAGSSDWSPTGNVK